MKLLNYLISFILSLLIFSACSDSDIASNKIKKLKKLFRNDALVNEYFYNENDQLIRQDFYDDSENLRTVISYKYYQDSITIEYEYVDIEIRLKYIYTDINSEIKRQTRYYNDEIDVYILLYYTDPVFGLEKQENYDSDGFMTEKFEFEYIDDHGSYNAINYYYWGEYEEKIFKSTTLKDDKNFAFYSTYLFKEFYRNSGNTLNIYLQDDGDTLPFSEYTYTYDEDDYPVSANLLDEKITIFKEGEKIIKYDTVSLRYEYY